MKYLLKSLLIVAIFVFLSPSCVNSDYDFDNIDTSGVFNIPPLMLGNLDPIELAELAPPSIIPPGINLPPIRVVYSYTLEGIFSGDAVERLFFDGAGNVSISAVVDVSLPLAGSVIDLHFFVTDEEGSRLTSVVIPHQRLVIANNQDLSIKIGSDYMKYMSGANGLEMVLVISNAGGSSSDLINVASRLHLRNVIVRTGGIKFDFDDL